VEQAAMIGEICGGHGF